MATRKQTNHTVGQPVTVKKQQPTEQFCTFFLLQYLCVNLLRSTTNQIKLRAECSENTEIRNRSIERRNKKIPLFVRLFNCKIHRLVCGSIDKHTPLLGCWNRQFWIHSAAIAQAHRLRDLYSTNCRCSALAVKSRFVPKPIQVYNTIQHRVCSNVRSLLHSNLQSLTTTASHIIHSIRIDLVSSKTSWIHWAWTLTAAIFYFFVLSKRWLLVTNQCSINRSLRFQDLLVQFSQSKHLAFFTVISHKIKLIDSNDAVFSIFLFFSFR